MNPYQCGDRPQMRDTTTVELHDEPTLIAVLPTGSGDWIITQLHGHAAPSDPNAREYLRAMLRIVEYNLAASEPCRTNGIEAQR
jgi:hypothetical protein